jgi:hypothetical protein
LASKTSKPCGVDADHLDLITATPLVRVLQDEDVLHVPIASAPLVQLLEDEPLMKTR